MAVQQRPARRIDCASANWGVVLLAALVSVLVVAGSAAAGDGKTKTVPSISGVDQYVETIPSATGGVTSGSSGKRAGTSHPSVVSDTSGGGGGPGIGVLLAIVLGAVAVTTAAGLGIRRGRPRRVRARRESPDPLR